jgi:hypothetical protein
MLSSCGTLASFTDGVNLLTNGSFEDGTGPDGPFKPNSQGLMSLQSGSTSLPGWTVVDNTQFGQDIAWVQNANPFVPNGATDGTHFLDLTGASDKADPNGHFGVIRQSFATIPRTRYWAAVDIGVKNPDYPGPIQVRIAVSATNSNLAEYAQVTCPYNPTAPGIQWMTNPPCSMEFTANSDNTLLSIYGESGKRYIGIDNVTVQCIAPLGRHAWCGGAPPL